MRIEITAAALVALFLAGTLIGYTAAALDPLDLQVDPLEPDRSTATHWHAATGAVLIGHTDNAGSLQVEYVIPPGNTIKTHPQEMKI